MNTVIDAAAALAKSLLPFGVNLKNKMRDKPKLEKKSVVVKKLVSIKKQKSVEKKNSPAPGSDSKTSQVSVPDSLKTV